MSPPSLFCSFSIETPEELKRKLDSGNSTFNEHHIVLVKLGTLDVDRCDCNDCKFIHNIIDTTRRYSEGYRIDFPDNKIYSKKELKQQLYYYIEEEEYYEARLFLEILEDWRGNSCFLRYADLPN